MYIVKDKKLGPNNNLNQTRLEDPNFSDSNLGRIKKEVTTFNIDQILNLSKDYNQVSSVLQR